MTIVWEPPLTIVWEPPLRPCDFDTSKTVNSDLQGLERMPITGLTMQIQPRPGSGQLPKAPWAIMSGCVCV